MKPIIAVENIASLFVTTLWTPIFVAIFIAIVTYAVWPRNKAAFDEAARMPLREEYIVMADHDHNDIDHVSGTATTGHAWDGIKELNTQLPRWWEITFYLTIIWSVGNWIDDPAWPLLSSNT